MEPTNSVSLQRTRAGAPPSTEGAGQEPSRPSEPSGSGPVLKREYTRLLSLQEHLRTQLELIQGELDAPGSRALLDEVRAHSVSSIPEALRHVRETIAEAVNMLADGESELRRLLENDPGELVLDGVANLPGRLARFVADRKDLPGFSYQIYQDEVRGWVVAWKEYGRNGIVRGAGQFYERPYAWLDE